jgi:hypothetical protein
MVECSSHAWKDWYWPSSVASIKFPIGGSVPWSCSYIHFNGSDIYRYYVTVAQYEWMWRWILVLISIRQNHLTSFLARGSWLINRYPIFMPWMNFVHTVFPGNLRPNLKAMQSQSFHACVRQHGYAGILASVFLQTSLQRSKLSINNLFRPNFLEDFTFSFFLFPPNCSRKRIAKHKHVGLDPQTHTRAHVYSKVAVPLYSFHWYD